MDISVVIFIQALVLQKHPALSVGLEVFFSFPPLSHFAPLVHWKEKEKTK